MLRTCFCQGWYKQAQAQQNWLGTHFGERYDCGRELSNKRRRVLAILGVMRNGRVSGRKTGIFVASDRRAGWIVSPGGLTTWNFMTETSGEWKLTALKVEGGNRIYRVRQSLPDGVN